MIFRLLIISFIAGELQDTVSLRLAQGTSLSFKNVDFCILFHKGAEIEQRTTASIGGARQKIGKEISELHEKLKVCKDAIHQMKSEIAKLEQQDQETQDTSTAPSVVQ